jgi:hypothetical protein
MIDYNNLQVGDLLSITGRGAPGWANIGDIVIVTKVEPNKLFAKKHPDDSDDDAAFFTDQCGAERLAHMLLPDIRAARRGMLADLAGHDNDALAAERNEVEDRINEDTAWLEAITAEGFYREALARMVNS